MMNVTVIRSNTYANAAGAQVIHQVISCSAGNGFAVYHQAYTVEPNGRTTNIFSCPWRDEQGAINEYEEYRSIGWE